MPPGQHPADEDIVEEGAPGSTSVIPQQDQLAPAGSEEPTSRVERLMSTSFSMMGNMANPIMEKITPQHITDTIALMREESVRWYGDRRHSRIITGLFATFLVVAVLVFIVVLVELDATDLVRDILPVAAALGVGVLGGYGLGISRRQ